MPQLTTWTRNIVLASCCYVALEITATSVVVGGGFMLNTTPSLPRGIYQKTQEPITRGVLVITCLPEQFALIGKERGWVNGGKCPGGVAPILKHVAAIEGDRVEITDSYVAVNDELILQTARQKEDSKGREVPAITPSVYVLKEGEVLLLATYTPQSLDGRYYGPTPITEIKTTARAVWVEK